ncbi:MAG: purine-nucleoside phosphorylase [Desulfovibrionaceae bacterium]|nr:purine-nucleoside phosphorylase [Desulfovibrionaceae bacterium]
MQNADVVARSVSKLREKLALKGTVPLGVILGTGLSGVTDGLDAREVPYSALPNFPCSTTASHKGSFVLAQSRGTPVLFAAGRCHLYEGWNASDVCMGVRVMHGLGVKTLVITNASGAINPQFDAGSLMCVTDQINMTGVSPLTGPNNDKWGIRFPDMSETFDRELLALATRTALDAKIPLLKGVYVGVHGPELETPAETRMLRMIGADAVGMSSVLEVICARHLGMRVLEISCLANKNLPDCMAPVSIEDILESCARAEAHLVTLLTGILGALGGR